MAYVAEDHELPLVNLSILVRVGNYLDPEGKEGLAVLAADQLTRGGAGSRTAEELEERLAFLAANLASGASDTQGSIGLNLLSKDLDEGLAILREVLTAPRFQEDKLALNRGARTRVPGVWGILLGQPLRDRGVARLHHP